MLNSLNSYKFHLNIFTFLEILIKIFQSNIYIKINNSVKNNLNLTKNAQFKTGLKKL